ncbi:MAG: GEVED domain-containing protein, partial [Bacteroidota bacterium]
MKKDYRDLDFSVERFLLRLVMVGLICSSTLPLFSQVICDEFFSNLECVGNCPDPDLEFTGTDQAAAYPSPLLVTEQVSPLFFGGGNFRGTDETYAVVVGGDFNVPPLGGSEVEGRIAIGGNFDMDRSPQYGISESGGGTFVIGAPGNYAIAIEGTASGDFPTNLGTNLGVNPGMVVNVGGVNTATFNNATVQDNQGSAGVDIASILMGVENVSVNASAATPTGSFSGNTLAGTNVALEIFNVSGAALPNGNLNFADIAPGATIVVNVSGTNLSTSFAPQNGRVNDPNNGTSDDDALVYNVVWNFYEATSLSISRDVNGLLLAPNANVDLLGNYNGRMFIGGDLNHVSGGVAFGTEIHNYPFTGDLTSFCTDPDPIECPFICSDGQSLLSWSDAGWNSGAGWTDNAATPQTFNDFDGNGNNVTATFVGNNPSGGTPGPNVYTGNTFGCTSAMRLTGANGTSSPADFPGELITFSNAIQLNRLYVAGMEQRNSSGRAEISIVTFRNGGVAIDPNIFTYNPLDAAHVEWQIAGNSIYIYGITEDEDGLLEIVTGGTLIDEIEWRVGEITDNTGTAPAFTYTGGNSSQWITPFCYTPESTAGGGACPNPLPFDLDWTDYPQFNEDGVTVYPYTEDAIDVAGSPVDVMVTVPRAAKDDNRVGTPTNGSGVTFSETGTYTPSDRVYRYWKQSDDQIDEMVFNFSEPIILDVFMYGGQRPPTSTSFAYSELIFWDGPNGTGNPVVSNFADPGGVTDINTGDPLVSAINVLQDRGDQTSFLSNGTYVGVGYNPGTRPWTALQLGGVEVRSITWKLYASTVDVSPAGTGSLDLSIAQANTRNSGNLSAYLSSFTFGLCLEQDQDYGDLPDTYGTLEGSNGPSHVVSEDLFLGACVDFEDDAAPEDMAGAMTGGDDNTAGMVLGTCTGDDDEDGITFVTPLIPDGQACVQVTAVNNTGAPAVLQGWIDYDGSGTFEAGEELTGFDFSGGADVPAGGLTDAILCFEVPTSATFTGQGEAFSRFRLSSEGGLESGGPAPIGEVEDYKEKLAKIGSYVWNDMNADGLQNDGPTAGIENAQLTLVFTNPFGADISYVTSTGPDGVYSFCGLIPGDYNLSIPTPPAMFSSATTVGVGMDNEINSDNHAGVSITITDVMALPLMEDSPNGDNPGGEGFPDMQDDLQYDFGYFMPANIGDYVWEDLNDDGTQDPNEPGLEGVTVTLYECNAGVKGMALTSTMTDGMGQYQFTGVAPGMEYCVEFDLSTANHPNADLLDWSPQNAGDGTNDSDVDPADASTAGCTGGYTPSANETYPDFDAGVNVRDYGDLPEGPYTTTGPGAPNHTVPANPEVFLGGGVDAEVDGQPNDDATGDGDDQDGVTKPDMIIRGGIADFMVDVVNTSGEDAKVVMFIDWDGNGLFDDTDGMQSVTTSVSGSFTLTFNVPSDAVINSDIGVRTRVSTDPDFVMNMPDGGFAYDGEVEDCLVQVMAFDYGDLSDLDEFTAPEDYQTLTINDGPRHKIITDDMGNVLLKIGDTVDDEPDGQPSMAADGDDADEDGFDPTAQMFVTGQAVDITIPVMNMTGDPAKLTVFIDWNRDGDFTDSGEMYFTDVPDMATSATITDIIPPFNTALNQELGFRIRLSSDMAASMSSTGLAPDGEVEDYLITVMGFDYGDLVDTGDGEGEQNYETEVANGGPSHKIISDDAGNITLKIGSLLDDEGDGQQSDDADGDATDQDDEDGFDPAAQMFVAGQSVDLTIPVMNMTGGDAKLTIFIDWNNDGDFDDMDEMYSDTVEDGDVEATIMGIVPPLTATLNDDLGVRIRLSTDVDASMNPEGPAPDGEVEDYEIVVMGFDYGDLNDAAPGTAEQDYETTAADNGAVHKILTDEADQQILKIGQLVDPEADVAPADDPNTDDNTTVGTGGNDEDGFDPTAYMFVTGTPVDFDVPVMNMTGEDAKLTLFIDWNNNGDFNDAGEMYSETVTDGTTTVSLSVTPPLSATLNDDIGVRFRLSPASDNNSMSPTGLVEGGEVEDYEIIVMGFDYGDLTDEGADGVTGEGDYATAADNDDAVADSDGPRHKILTNEDDMVTLKMGATVDDEAASQEADDAGTDDDAQADGDDAAEEADEDGFDAANTMFVSGIAQDITIPVMNMTGEAAKVVMFVDWNNDGDFEDVDEMYSTDVADGATEAVLAGVTPPLADVVLNDVLGVRFRISPMADANAMSPTGEVAGGEVEDYVITVMGFDYGDLPDAMPGTAGDPTMPEVVGDYQTTIADDGAAHKISTNEDDMATLKIGAAVDDEADGQPVADAGETTGGDDNTATPADDPNDEDGLDYNDLPLFILTQTTDVVLPVMNMTGAPATVALYLDMNKDGVLDPNTEKFTATVNDGDTEVTVSVSVPVDAVVGQDVGLRIRIANDMAEVMSPTGMASSGEVEDYIVQIIGYDFGDLPDTYTTTGNDAPRHIISEALKLGACVDTELDGLPESMAGMMEGGDDADPGLATFGTCVDGDDEDGIEFTHPMIPGNESCITVTAMNMTAEDAVLQVWIDWNGDGMFGAGEE